MRSSKSRSRGNKSRNRPTGGNIINRVFDSSGPDGKVRGTPQQIIDKYNQLHRDAALAGDRVDAENYAQHAEHYTRILAEAMREIDKQREQQENQNRDRQSDRDRQAERDRERTEQQENQNRDRQSDRDRQAERDRERTERLRAQERAAAEPGSFDLGDGDSGDSTLVETPEAKGEARGADADPAEGQAADAPPKKPRRSRAKKPKPEDGAQSDAGNGTPDDGGSQKQAAE